MGIDEGQMPIGLVWIGCLHRMGGRGGGVETFGVIGINVSTLSSNVVNALQNIFLLWIVETNIMQVICW